MKAGIVFTATGPLLIITNMDSLDDPAIGRRLVSKGYDKYIAFEVPVEKVKEMYGRHFAVASHDFRQTDELRVVDGDGQRIFMNFHFDELVGEPIYHEEQPMRKAA